VDHETPPVLEVQPVDREVGPPTMNWETPFDAPSKWKRSRICAPFGFHTWGIF